MDNRNIKISVILSAYNADKYLREAIDSILNQTFRDFEFIIINDGSTDDTAEIISSYDDKRIVYIDNVQNKGFVYSLNLGLSRSRGEYIGRMDADDITSLDRLQIQYDFMEAHPEIGICGTNMESFFEDSSRKNMINIYPETDKMIRAYTFFQNPFSHPTVLIRRNLIEENNLRYTTQYLGSEDYTLWIEILRYMQAYNIQKPLYQYRRHPESITMIIEKADKKNYNSSMIQETYMNRNGIYLPSEDMLPFSRFANRSIDLPLGKEDQKKYNDIYESFFSQLENKQPELTSIAMNYVSTACFYRFFRNKKFPSQPFLRKLYFKGLHSFSKKALSLCFKTI